MFEGMAIYQARPCSQSAFMLHPSIASEITWNLLPALISAKPRWLWRRTALQRNRRTMEAGLLTLAPGLHIRRFVLWS